MVSCTGAAFVGLWQSEADLASWTDRRLAGRGGNIRDHSSARASRTSPESGRHGLSERRRRAQPRRNGA